MQPAVSFIIKSVIASGILYAYYLAALRNKKFHSYNRFYLLGAVAVSVAVPLMNFSWYTIRQPQNAPLNNVLAIISSKGANDKPFHVTTGIVLFAGAAMVSVFLLFILLLKICWIYNIKRKHENRRMQGFTLIETTMRQAPFSFFDNLFWKKGVAIYGAGAEKIFDHELTHIRQKHTCDKLFTQLVVCICWMNPFYWLMQKELNMVHEFIADEGCINDGDTEAFAMMLLQSHNGGRYLNPAHSFFCSPIKRRLIMITTSKKTPYSYARRVLALPAAIFILSVFSFKITRAQNDPKLTPNESVKITKITWLRKPANNNPADTGSVDLKVEYVKPDGAVAVLNLTNIGYGKDDSFVHRKIIKLPDVTEHALTPQDVRAWAQTVIQNPPDALYYLDGTEISRDAIRKLDIATIKTARVFRGDEAIKQYGQRGENGVILFTTK